MTENLSINLNKIKKVWTEKGAIIALRKLIHATGRSLGSSKKIRVQLNQKDIFSNLGREALEKDFNNLFSTGLFRDLDKVASDIRRIPISIAKKIINKAESLSKNKFTIYGHLEIQFDVDKFSWLVDDFTGFEWPHILSLTQYKTQKPYGTDIKTVWEIARFQFLSLVSKAYILTGEEQYAHFAIDKVNSWIEENQFLFGPHWTVPMESSIRLLNWCVYLPLLDVFKYADHSFKNKITKSILEHLIYIRGNLEVSPFGAGNHYFADLVGLLLARLLFPSLSWAIETSEFAEKEFEREVRRQFTTSGINFEGSLPYHRLSSEMLLIGVALIKKSGREVPSGIVERLREVDDFTRYYTDTCEDCPIIGDNDSGVFVKFFIGQESNRHRYLKDLFDCILENMVEPDSWEGFLCSLHFTCPDPSHISRPNKIDENCDNILKVRDFNGLVIAIHKSEAIFFNTLHSSEGHTHNDKLSIYPVIGKKAIFIDRGSFSYTGFIEKRHKDRMTFSHNGPVINGWEQNRIWKNDLFYVNGEAKCNTSIDSSDNIVSITGCHHGYRRYSPGLKVFRKVDWNVAERIMKISDWVESKKNNMEFMFSWNFLLNPDWIEALENKTLKLTGEGMTAYFVDMDGIGFTLTNGFYCPNYQIELPCKSLTASRKVRPGEKIQFLLKY